MVGSQRASIGKVGPRDYQGSDEFASSQQVSDRPAQDARVGVKSSEADLILTKHISPGQVLVSAHREFQCVVLPILRKGVSDNVAF